MIITIVRKPLIKNVVENITLHNTGGINIEECRIGDEDTRSPTSLSALGQNSGWNNHENRVVLAGSANGRFPSNVFISEKGGESLDKQSGVLKSGKLSATQYEKGGRDNQSMFAGAGVFKHKGYEESVGGASKFFKVVKEDE